MIAEDIQSHNVVTARFPKAALKRLRQAQKVLGCSRTDLIVAGTLAEIERRTKDIELTERGEASNGLAPVFTN